MGDSKKRAFVDCVLAQPISEDEWGHYHRIRHAQTGNPFDSEYDPNHEVFSDKEHFHFVLYNNHEIIGIAHVQFFNEEVCAIISIAIDTPYQSQGYGTHLLQLVEQWIHGEGRSGIQIHSESKTVKFYEKSDYVVQFRSLPENECILVKWLCK